MKLWKFFDALSRLANQSYPLAQYAVGDCHRYGIGTLEYLSVGVRWYRKAADGGYVPAQYAAGNSFAYRGFFLGGLPMDEERAVAYFRKAAEQGHAASQYKMGDCYQFGRGVSRDEKLAIEWFRKAAAQGNADAIHSLGQCYQFGTTGIEVDKKRAVEYYERVAELGCADAQYSLGSIYRNGIPGVVEANLITALKWFRKAGHQNDERALGALAEIYVQHPHAGFDERSEFSPAESGAWVQDKSFISYGTRLYTGDDKSIIKIEDLAPELATIEVDIFKPNLTDTNLKKRIPRFFKEKPLYAGNDYTCGLHSFTASSATAYSAPIQTTLSPVTLIPSSNNNRARCCMR